MTMSRQERERRYGLDPDDYTWLAETNSLRCWICQQPEPVPNRRLAIDHDHTTGSVRGLLCTRCNQVLGRMGDDPVLLRAAADYLDRARDAYSDSCQECMKNGQDKWIYPPIDIAETDGAWTCFRYRCDLEHTWTCGHRTFGVPFRWRLA